MIKKLVSKKGLSLKFISVLGVSTLQQMFIHFSHFFLVQTNTYKLFFVINMQKICKKEQGW